MHSNGMKCCHFGLGIENSSQEGQLHGAEDQGLFLTPLQLSRDTSAKLLMLTLLYPFINMLDRHIKKCNFLS